MNVALSSCNNNCRGALRQEANSVFHSDVCILHLLLKVVCKTSLAVSSC